jgi:hypothetical protein
MYKRRRKKDPKNIDKMIERKKYKELKRWLNNELKESWLMNENICRGRMNKSGGKVSERKRRDEGMNEWMNGKNVNVEDSSMPVEGKFLN